jgi:hypothetical protein
VEPGIDDEPDPTTTVSKVVLLDTKPRRMPPARHRFDLSRAELSELLEGEPRYRVDQIWEGLYEQGKDIDEITSLPKALRARLSSEPALGPALTVALEKRSEHGETVKWLWNLADNTAIESVLMHYRELLAGGLCNGVWLLRDRSSRVRTPPHDW